MITADPHPDLVPRMGRHVDVERYRIVEPFAHTRQGCPRPRGLLGTQWARVGPRDTQHTQDTLWHDTGGYCKKPFLYKHVRGNRELTAPILHVRTTTHEGRGCHGIPRYIRDWSLITGRRGGGDYKMGNLRIWKMLCPPPPPPSRQGKTYCAPPHALLKNGNLFCPLFDIAKTSNYRVKTTPKLFVPAKPPPPPPLQHS